MDIEEFRFILQDVKGEIQHIPSLQSLLKLTEKTTKKLECLNLYSQMDRRDFDLEIEEENIYTEMNELYKAISAVQEEAPNEQQMQIIETRINEIKQKYIRTFDVLTKQEDILNQQLSFVETLLKQDQKKDQINQIKELDEYEDQQFQQINDPSNDYANLEGEFNNPKIRVEKLKIQIDQIHKKIMQINNGKGKWFDTDHKDFIKIYNRCGGNDKKIINEGIKVLGMKQTEIMDHLELYQNYLQLEKQKKLASEQYKQIKFFQQEEKRQVEQQKQQLKRLEIKLKKQKQLEERMRKKQQIQNYKLKKAQQKEKMIQLQEEEEKVKFKAPPLQPSKKKDIMERNRLFLQNQQKKILQSKIRKQSVQIKKSIGIQDKKGSSQIRRVPSSMNKNHPKSSEKGSKL